MLYRKLRIILFILQAGHETTHGRVIMKKGVDIILNLYCASDNEHWSMSAVTNSTNECAQSKYNNNKNIARARGEQFRHWRQAGTYMYLGRSVKRHSVCSLQWCYNERHMASQITTLAIVFPSVYSRHRSKKISKLRVTGLCEGNLPVTGEFPTQRYSNSENVSIWWRRHVESGLVRRPGSNPSTVPVCCDAPCMFKLSIRCNVILRQLSVKRMELWQWNTTASSKHRRIIEEKHVSGAGANDYISQYLWDVITCPRPWYLLPTHN